MTQNTEYGIQKEKKGCDYVNKGVTIKSKSKHIKWPY